MNILLIVLAITLLAVCTVMGAMCLSVLVSIAKVDSDDNFID